MPNTRDEKRIIKNKNGLEFFVLRDKNEHGEILLKNVETSEYVVARGWSDETKEWDHGHYTSSYQDAWNYYATTESQEKKLQDKIHLFVDMDGTLCKFTPVDTLEKLYQKGWFLDAEPQMNVVDAIKGIATDASNNVEVFILTSYLADSEHAFYEKQEWLDRYLPEIRDDHRIYVECGESKSNPDNWLWATDIADEADECGNLSYDEYHRYDKYNRATQGYMRDYFRRNGLGDNDFLLDDYTKNLIDWEPPGKGLKLLNGINHTKGTWQGALIPKDAVDFCEHACSSELKKILYSTNAYQNASKECAEMKMVTLVPDNEPVELAVADRTGYEKETSFTSRSNDNEVGR